MKLNIHCYGLVAVVAALAIAQQGLAGDCMFGCLTRPACGKVCKLVCEEKTLTAVGYGCQCVPICVPGPSCRGCKHCDVTCCCNTPAAVKGCPPKIEFCWYDWCARGCACPREVKVLTKFQAERKICWYHWEVVDGCICGCDPGCGCDCVYKAAPDSAQIGLALPLSPADAVELATWMQTDLAKRNGQLADEFNVPEIDAATATAQQPTATANTTTDGKPSITSRFSSLFKLGK